jgi:hypothetical protein
MRRRRAAAGGSPTGLAQVRELLQRHGMRDTAFSVGGWRRLATAYERDDSTTGAPGVDDAPGGR